MHLPAVDDFVTDRRLGRLRAAVAVATYLQLTPRWPTVYLASSPPSRGRVDVGAFLQQQQPEIYRVADGEHLRL